MKIAAEKTLNCVKGGWLVDGWLDGGSGGGGAGGG